ncbi:MAG: NADH-quinone oxidoreductase subunit N [Planctomycetes bacterium]|nr:NADH-quinone oxidoreductase subunit N [Planctomycetota bacterium]
MLHIAIETAANAMNDFNYDVLMPLIVLAITGSAALLLDLFLARGESRRSVSMLCVTGLIIAAGFCANELGTNATFWNGAVKIDSLGLVGSMICLVATGLVMLGSESFLKKHKRLGGEYYALMLFSSLGMVTMCIAADFITMFLGIEIMSIAVYVLTGYFRDDTKSSEASMKYFVLGAFATGFFLLGVACLYGEYKTFELSKFVNGSLTESSTLALFGCALVLIGFFFKLGAAPLQVWVPDVYEGAPTTVTAFMATGVKTAGFVALLRICTSFTIFWEERLVVLFGAIALLTMILGNFLAIVQRRVKRMLAYSSIAHTGYLFLGLLIAMVKKAPGADQGHLIQDANAAILFYLLGYTFATVGAFIVLSALSRGGRDVETFDDLEGLGWRHPVLGVALTIFLVSLAGIPVTAGFFGKFFIFRTALLYDDAYIPIVVAAVMLSVISVAYYLKASVHLFFRGKAYEGPELETGWDASFVTLLCFAGTIFLGVMPDSFYALCKSAASEIQVILQVAAN